jgi:hypothetical protein
LTLIAIGDLAVLWNRRWQETAMPRFRIALSALLLVAACKKSDKPVEPAPDLVRGTAARPTIAAKSSEPPLARPAGDPRRPVESVPLDPELEAKGLEMMQQLADVVAADAASCSKLAADIKAFAVQNKLLLSRLVAAESQETEGQRAEFSRRNAAAQAAVAQKMQTAMTACSGDPAVLAALQEFPGE